jgi:uncharacterized protein YbaR (Trm112 family)
MAMPLAAELLEKLACPKCIGPLGLAADGRGLTCASCALLFEIEDDIPCMLLELAKPLPPSTTDPD